MDCRSDREQEPDPRQGRSGVPVSRLVHSEDDSQHNAKRDHQDRRSEDDPVHPSSVHDTLAREEMVVEIAQGAEDTRTPTSPVRA